MGKQGRKKQRQKRQQDKKKIHQGGDQDGSSQSPAVNAASAVHQLRHADPHIRLNALVALQATILRPATSSSAATTKRVSVPVLQAVREQILDSNLECASAAAECLAQYLSTASHVELLSATTASWTLVFLARLGQCHQAIQTSNSSNNANKGDGKKIKQWFALAAPTLRALCNLIENNEQALNQLNTEADQFLGTIVGLLQDVGSFQQPSTVDPRLTGWVEETATYAARALHSSLDDNLDMVSHINNTPTSADPNAWIQLLSSIPELAQLHLCGSLVTMFQMAPTEWQSTCLIQHVIPSLTQRAVKSVSPQQLQSLEMEYSNAVALWKTQQEDEQLEGEIVRKIQDRKEPARLIARRQKEMDRGGAPGGAKFNEEDTKDGEQAMEDALVAWNGVLLPLQVSLEVSANLLSSFIREENAMEQDEGILGQRIHQTLVSANFADAVLQVLQTMCTYYKSREERAAQQAEQQVLTDDLKEVISKCSACMTNCVLSEVLSTTNYETTWLALEPHATAPGVARVLVVLAQRHGNIALPADSRLIQQLLQSTDEECQRDGVCLLVGVLNSNSTAVSDDTVQKATAELLRLLGSGPTVVKVEILNAIMDLWGQDDFYPHVFSDQQVLSSFQAALTSLSKWKDIDEESEEILFNASRFVDYKLGR